MGLSEQQFKNIMNEYEALRIEAENRRENRIAALYKTYPDIKAADDEIALSALSFSRNILKNSNNTDYQAKLDELNNRKVELLRRYGISSDIYDVKYSCPACHDTGFIGRTPCKCFIRKASKLLYTYSNLDHILATENFDTFNISLYQDKYPYDNETPLTPMENIKRVMGVVENFINNFEYSHESFYIYGEAGVGKSFLTHCIAKSLMDKAYSVIYLTAINFFELLSDKKFNRTKDDEYMDFIDSCDLLIIDDLGTELSNSFTDSELYHMIDNRILTEKSTIISSNLEISDLRKRYSERITSRIVGYYTFLRIVGEDLRKPYRD